METIAFVFEDQKTQHAGNRVDKLSKTESYLITEWSLNQIKSNQITDVTCKPSSFIVQYLQSQKQYSCSERLHYGYSDVDNKSKLNVLFDE